MGKSTLPHYPYLRQLVTSHALFISLLTCTLAVTPALPLETARAWPRAAAVGPAAVARPGRPSVDDISHWRSSSSTLISPHADHVPLDEPVSDLYALLAPQSAHSLITDTKPPTRQAAIHHLRLPSASSLDSYTLYKRRRRTLGSVKLLGLDNLDFTSSTLDKALDEGPGAGGGGSWQTPQYPGGRVRDQAPPSQPRLTYPGDQRRLPTTVKLKDLRKMLEELENAGR